MNLPKSKYKRRKRRKGHFWGVSFYHEIVEVKSHKNKEEVKSMIRKVQTNEYGQLVDFLYEAIFVKEGEVPPNRDIVNQPELSIYIDEFGEYKDDEALFYVLNGRAVGAIWVRIMDDYGHIDRQTPSLAMSVLKPYRHQGIGRQLLQAMLALLKQKGYERVSLSVSKENTVAIHLYQKLGFLTLLEREEDLLMICYLGPLR